MPPKTASRAPLRIQTYFSGELDYFREILLGVRRYGFTSGELEVADRWMAHEWEGDVRRRLERDGISGVVATLHTTAEQRRFAGLGVPVVNVSNAFLRPRLPVVTQDDEAVGRLAAAHLQACACRSFGFWGHGRCGYSEGRRRGFERALAGERVARASGGHDLGKERERMRAWLATLPRPAGVFAVLDTFALALMRAAGDLGWSVPEDVAVLGAGNDDFWVEFERVPLSSVRLPARRIGEEAAATLHRRILATNTPGGRGVGAEPLVRRIAVGEVVARRSTDILHSADAVVARALLHIRSHAHENPYVADVARAAGASPVSLARRFREATGRTVLAELQRERVRRAQALLMETDLPLGVVAERCGFPNSQRFSVLFRQIAGVAPGAYRRELQIRRE